MQKLIPRIARNCTVRTHHAEFAIQFQFCTYICIYNNMSQYNESTCPVGFNLKFLRFISPFAMGFLYARVKLLTFTADKRRTGSLARKQRTHGVGPRKLVGKVFSRVCHLFTLEFTSKSFEHANCNFLL